MIASRIHEVAQAFQHLSQRERDTATNFLLGFSMPYVPDDKWAAVVQAAVDAATAGRKPPPPPPQRSGKDAAAGPDL